MLPSIWALPRRSAAAHDPASGPDSLCPTPLVQLDQHANRLGLAVEVPGVAVQILVREPAEGCLEGEGVRDHIAVVPQPPMARRLAHAVGAQPLGQASVATPLAHPVAEAGRRLEGPVELGVDESEAV